MVERGSSEVLPTQMTDNGPVYHAWSVQLSRAKLIARAVAKYSKSRVWRKVPHGSTLIFGDTRISL